MSVMNAASLCMNINYALVSSVLHASILEISNTVSVVVTATHDIRTGDSWRRLNPCVHFLVYNYDQFAPVCCIPFPTDYLASLGETAWHEDLNRISSEGGVMYTAWQAFVVNTSCTEEMSFIINPHTALTAFFIMHFSCNPVLLLFPNCSLIKLVFLSPRITP